MTGHAVVQTAGPGGARGPDSRELAQRSHRADTRREADTLQRHHIQAHHHPQQQQQAAQQQAVQQQAAQHQVAQQQAQRHLQAQHAQQALRQQHARALRDTTAVSAQDLIRGGPQRPGRERDRDQEREEPPGSGGGSGSQMAKVSLGQNAVGDDGHGVMPMQVGSMSMQKLAALRVMPEAAEAGGTPWQGLSAEQEHLHAVSTGTDHGPLSWPSGSAPLTTSLQAQPERNTLFPGPLGRWWNTAAKQQPLGAAAQPHSAAPQLPPHPVLTAAQPSQHAGAPAANPAEPGRAGPACAGADGAAMQADVSNAAGAAGAGPEAAGASDRVSGADAAGPPVTKAFSGSVAEGVPVIQRGALPGGVTVGVGVPVVATGVPITGADELRSETAAAPAAAAAVMAGDANRVVSELPVRGHDGAEGDVDGAQRAVKRFADIGVQSPSTKAAKVSSGEPGEK